MRHEILRNTQATLQTTFYSGGSATDADASVTVVALGADGGTAAAGTAVSAGTGTGAYQYALAPQPALDLLTVTWTGAFGAVTQSVTTYAEVVGGHYVTLADIRALRSLTSPSTYPNARLIEVRSWFADRAESFCGVSFVPRYGRDVLDGDGSKAVYLSHSHPRVLEDAFVDSTEVTDLSDWELYPSGKVYRNDAGAFASGRRNVVIQYEHGYDAPPEDLREAALVAIRYKLLGDQSGIPERATTMATEVGTFNLALAGANRPTGIPEVDAVLVNLSEKVPLVG